MSWSTPPRNKGASRATAPQRHETSAKPSLRHVKETQAKTRTKELIKYDPSLEAFPRKAVYSDKFPLVEQGITKACDTFIDAYEKLIPKGYDNKDLAKICDLLKRSRSPALTYPPVNGTATLGPAGSGKSSTINSLLNEPCAAYEHDGGERGTFVVHEYRKMLPKQLSPFIAAVSFHSQESIVKIVKQQLEVLQNHYMPSEDDEEPDHGSEEAAYDDMIKTAVFFFADVFGQSESETQTYFQEHYVDTQNSTALFTERILSRVLNVLTDRKRQRVDGERIVRDEIRLKELTTDTGGETEHFRAVDAKELGTKIKSIARPFKNPQGPPVASAWPLIRQVTIHQSSKILNHDVVIADLPGYNDQNLMVKSNALSYLCSADTTLIFLSYKRILHNSPLDELLRRCLTAEMSGGIRVVVTHIDQMKLFNEDELGILKRDELREIQRCSREYEELERETKIIEQRKEDAEDEDDTISYARHDMELSKLKERLAQADAARHQKTILIRCSIIRNSLKDKLRIVAKSELEPDLEITFVSNTVYQQHLQGFRAKKVPVLDAWACGIPALRSSLLEIPAHGKVEYLSGLCQNRLPNALHGIRGILFETKLRRKAEIRTSLVNALRPIRSRTAAALHGPALKEFDDHVTQEITTHMDLWMETAFSRLEEWHVRMRSGTFGAICKRGGEWNKKGGPVYDLNFELQLIFADEIADGFNKVTPIVVSNATDFLSDIVTFLENIEHNLGNQHSAQDAKLQTVYEYVEGETIRLKTEMEDHCDKLGLELRKLKFRSILGSHTSYCAKIMSPAWKICGGMNYKNFDDDPDSEFKEQYSQSPSKKIKCKDDTTGNTFSRPRGRKSQTVFRRRLNHLRGFFEGNDSGENLYEAIGRQARRDFRDYLLTWSHDADKIIRSALDDILTDFDRRFVHDKPLTKQEKAAKKFRNTCEKSLKEAQASSRYILENEVLKHLEECIEYEKPLPTDTDVEMTGQDSDQSVQKSPSTTLHLRKPK